MAHVLIFALCARRRQQNARRGRLGFLPCARKAELRYGDIWLHHHAARRHDAVPVDPERAASRAAGHLLPRRPVAHFALRRSDTGAHRLGALAEHLVRKPQPVPAHAAGGSLLKGKTIVAAGRVLVAAHGREHVRRHLHRCAELGRYGIDRVHIIDIVRRHGSVELHADAERLERADIVHDAVIHRPAAQPFICLIAAAVERDVHARRRLMPEKIQPVVVDERCVAVDGHHEPHLLELGEQIAEIRANKRLSAGQQQKQHPLAACLLRDGEPLVRGELRPAPPLLLGREVHVTHAAVEVAARRELKVSRKRDALCAGTRVEIRCSSVPYQIPPNLPRRVSTAVASGKQSMRSTGTSETSRATHSVICSAERASHS